MICSILAREIQDYLLGNKIIDIASRKLSNEFRTINEYDDIRITLSNNILLRVQCTLRILFEKKISLISNDRYLTDNQFDVDDGYVDNSYFNAKVEKISWAMLYQCIVAIRFSPLGDIKIITNSNFELQIIIDTRRDVCYSYDIIDFNAGTIIRVYFKEGKIIATKSKW